MPSLYDKDRGNFSAELMQPFGELLAAEASWRMGFDTRLRATKLRIWDSFT